MIPPPTVLYSCTLGPKYTLALRHSITSVRRTSPGVPILFVAFGACDDSTRRFLDEQAVELVIDDRRRLGANVTWCKWLALDHVTAADVLVLDPDTHAFGDVTALASIAPEARFVARQEPGTQRDRWPYLVGSSVVHPKIAWPLFEQIAARVGARVAPLFNTGVMLMRGIAPALRAQIPFGLELVDAWRAGRLPYPCSNRYIAEELAVALMIGRTTDAHALLAADVSPFYFEWKGGAVAGPGTVMHVWANYLRYFYADFLGEKAAEAYRAAEDDDRAAQRAAKALRTHQETP